MSNETCPNCGSIFNHICSCSRNSSSDYAYIEQINKPKPNYGWVCSLCDQCNAPWKSKCDCNLPTLTAGIESKDGL